MGGNNCAYHDKECSLSSANGDTAETIYVIDMKTHLSRSTLEQRAASLGFSNTPDCS